MKPKLGTAMLEGYTNVHAKFQLLTGKKNFYKILFLRFIKKSIRKNFRWRTFFKTAQTRPSGRQFLVQVSGVLAIFCHLKFFEIGIERT